MVGLLVAWVAFPLAVLAIAGGIGLLVQRYAGAACPPGLLIPVGIAAIVVVSNLVTTLSFAARWTVPVVVALAVAGWVLSWRRVVPARGALVACAVALATGLSIAAPVVLTGQATFGGYAVLGDTVFHLLGADALPERGHDFGALTPSSYEGTLHAYFDSSGYPAGGAAALGALTRVVGGDPAWTLHPFIALLVAALALSLLSLLVASGVSRPLAAVGAAVAAQPALLYAYAQMESLKEVGAASMLALVAASALHWRRLDKRRIVMLLPTALATAAALAFVGSVVLAWIGPLLVLVMASELVERGATQRRAAVLSAVAFVGLVAIMSLQTLLGARAYVTAGSGVLTAQTELGNLVGLLSPWQVVGVWLSGDFRLRPLPNVDDLSTALIGITIAAAFLGICECVRRRSAVPLAYAAATAVALVVLLPRGSPWADGKVLMISAPTVVLMAAIGASGLARAGRRVEGTGLLAAVAAGVLLSNAYLYHSASPAPRERFAELKGLAQTVDGSGPTLLLDWDETAKHFLRDGDPVNPNEAYVELNAHLGDPVYGTAGEAGRFNAAPGASLDADQLPIKFVDQFQWIVMRHRSSTSRPPSTFSVFSRGRFYDLWRRQDRAVSRVVEHRGAVAFGTRAGGIGCRSLRELADAAGARGRLAYPARVQQSRIVANIATSFHSPIWVPAGGDETLLHPLGPGRASSEIVVKSADRYRVWMYASLDRAVRVFVDGRAVGAVERRLNFGGLEERLGSVDLTPGKHEVELVMRGGDLRPGNGNVSPNRTLGAVTLRPDGDDTRIESVPGTQWRSLCGQRLDWVEAWRAQS